MFMATYLVDKVKWGLMYPVYCFYEHHEIIAGFQQFAKTCFLLPPAQTARAAKHASHVRTRSEECTYVYIYMKHALWFSQVRNPCFLRVVSIKHCMWFALITMIGVRFGVLIMHTEVHNKNKRSSLSTIKNIPKNVLQKPVRHLSRLPGNKSIEQEDKQIIRTIYIIRNHKYKVRM